MQKVSRTSIIKAVEGAMIPGVRRATVYQSPQMVVKATRRHKGRKNERQTEWVLTVGVPNFAERKFIKDCKDAGEIFPVRDVQLVWYPGEGTR